ncbi:MAG: DUF4355 domain-containing protein [bacterium]|nr:DUF4355 domain-containing protein [bacterium]
MEGLDQEQTQLEGANGVPPVEPTEVDLLKKEVQDMKEEFKKELSGLNRKNSELETEKKELERQGLEEKERTKLELEDVKEARLKEESELKSLRRIRVVENTLVDAGLPLDLANRINGDLDEDIKADVTALKDWFQSAVEKEAEKITNERLGGKPPVDGKMPEEKAMKRSDWMLLNPQDQKEFMNSGGKLYD